MQKILRSVAVNGWLMCAAASAVAAPKAPVVLYTDALSGPTSGGENKLGAYLSIFGKNFGAPSGLGKTTRVFIGNAEVANYRTLSPSIVFTKLAIQRLTVQVGPLGRAPMGVPAAVKVVVNGVASNTNLTFTPNEGRVLFVALTGNDVTAVPNDIKRPWRNLQDSAASRGAYYALRAGDHVVIRGGNWSDANGIDATWLRFGKDPGKKGSPPSGSPTGGWIHITAYPGPANGNLPEAVSYTTPAGKAGGIQGPWSAIRGVSGRYISISNLHLAASETTRRDGAPINVQYSDGPWNIVNNELGPWPSTLSAPGNAKAGGVAGEGNPVWIHGNYIHDIDCAHGQAFNPLENHGIYIDHGGVFDIGWNVIFNIRGGNGVQIYTSGGATTTTNDIVIHHNYIFGAIGKHGLNLADGTGSGILVYDNVIADAALGGIRINSTELRGKIWNNTIYNVNQSRNPSAAAIMTDTGLTPSALQVTNNIIWPAWGGYYTGGSVGFSGRESTWTNNLFFGGRQRDDSPAPAGATGSIEGDPGMVAPGSDFRLEPKSPARDKGSSSVSSLVKDDLDSVPRPRGAAWDIGAFELDEGGR